jgi:hypothetical protein
MVLTLAPINMESMAAPWERSFTKGWITVTLDEFYKVVLTKKPKEFLKVLGCQTDSWFAISSE